MALRQADSHWYLLVSARRSRGIQVFTVAAHGLALLGLMTSGSLRVYGLGIVCWLFSVAWCWRHGQASTESLELGPNGHCQSWSLAGDPYPARLEPDSVVWRWLVVLHWRQDSGDGRASARRMLLTPDMMPPQVWRRLQILLRHWSEPDEP